MITSLSIENFALIEKLSIQFSNGFSTITGETGAGKSILLGALGLVLGKRADLTSLKNKEEKCIVEATFFLKNYNLQSFFLDNDLDYEDETIIRREILPSGKSRAFINDTPVNLQELQDLSAFLVDIHSQHQTQDLSDDSYQFQIIDSVANNFDLLNEYKIALKEYKAIISSIEEKKLKLSSVIKEQDYNTFLLEELVNAKLKGLDQVELESTYEKLNNVELIKEQLQKISSISNEEQFGVIQNLKEIKIAFQKVAGFSKEYELLLERLNSVIIEFDDIEKETSNQADALLSDPEQLELVNQQLQDIYSLQRKHNVSSVEELLHIQNELDQKVISVTTLEDEIAALKNRSEEVETDLRKVAKEISQKRIQFVSVLVEKTQNILAQLGMPNAQIKFDIKPTDKFLSNGSDEIQLLFSANKGSDFGLLKKVASGGELSRIMLAIKSILAQHSKLPTILFDEIDTGVSGEIAHKMGEIMKQMSQSMQVLSITHLPQIASKGTAHFKVFKKEEAHHTITQIVKLNDQERINEIAQMLSGSTITESALNNAKELLK
ncbi:DNA repair protein RecN [Flavobacterium sp.]|uniref:DNA repair protein RecN n=1 Tax=Flavobacterium sp. TaxID=239 RepID=UPI002B4ACFBE|nr:DNA repair protein RecN [Flavobacterium sp.]HLP65115.1 DNA repair protein RecN [Flavobacterium sp.]